MTDKFKFGARSLRELQDVVPDLVAVAKLALKLSEVDFAITDGKRTLEEQKEYVRTGASITMKSRHLTGHAVDVCACLPNGKISYAKPLMFKIKEAFFAAAKELNVPIRWGGDFNQNGKEDDSFYDSPHFEIPRSKKYP